jgi:hypothetical protein
MMSAFRMNLVSILVAIGGAAVLERYPDVRIAIGESGIGWVPYGFCDQRLLAAAVPRHPVSTVSAQAG